MKDAKSSQLSSRHDNSPSKKVFMSIMYIEFNILFFFISKNLEKNSILPDKQGNHRLKMIHYNFKINNVSF